MSAPASSIDLYWLPLGAGGYSVRLNGRAYEAVAARLARRAPCALYHSALIVEAAGGRYVVEQAPVPRGDPRERGVVAGGAVGHRAVGWLRLFRYEIRCWREGVIPDLVEAVESPRRLSSDPDQAARLIAALPSVPTPVWGRDSLGAGEMWNSNSVIAWSLERSGIDTSAVTLPAGGRAPGWAAGRVVARRQATG